MKKRISKITCGNLSLAKEREFRETEVCFYAELLTENDQILPTLNRALVPYTVDDGNNNNVLVGEKKVKIKQVRDHAQVQMKQDNFSIGIRRITYISGNIEYRLRFKHGEHGAKVETDICLDNEGFSAFNMMARVLGSVMYVTRLIVRDESDITYEIDVPLLRGEHARDYSAEHGKFIKVDVEHDGSLTAQAAMENFPFPVKRFITDRAEIDELHKLMTRNKIH